MHENILGQNIIVFNVNDHLLLGLFSKGENNEIVAVCVRCLASVVWINVGNPA